MSNEVRVYTLIFMFSPDLSDVLLLRKSTPPWQQGLWNGPGGKIERGETEAEGAARELREETGLFVIPSDLTFILRFSCDCENGRMENADIHEIAVYAARMNSKDLKTAHGSDKEPVKVWPVLTGLMSVERVSYVKHLLALSIERLEQNSGKGVVRCQKCVRK